MNTTQTEATRKSQLFGLLTVPGAVLALLCVLYLILFMDRVSLNTPRPMMMKDLGLTNTQLGIAFSAFALRLPSRLAAASRRERAVEKPLAPRAWKSLRDFHFPTAPTTVLRLHFKWRDDHPYGYILKWLDRSAPRRNPSLLDTSGGQC